MGLPDQREETLHIQSRLAAALLNALQDLIVWLYGTGWTSQQRLPIPAHWSGRNEAGDWTLTAGDYTLQSTDDGKKLRMPVPLRAGTRIDEVLVSIRPVSAALMTVRLVEITSVASGSSFPTRTVLATKSSTADAAWEEISLKPLKANGGPYELLADCGYVIEVDASGVPGGGDRVSGAEVVYRKSRLT